MKFQLASTLHNHTTLSDGRHTPEQMVLAALDAGMTDFGISDHSCTPHDLRYCIADTQRTRRMLARASGALCVADPAARRHRALFFWAGAGQAAI
jgi:hypothetical protein